MMNTGGTFSRFGCRMGVFCWVTLLLTVVRASRCVAQTQYGAIYLQPNKDVGSALYGSTPQGVFDVIVTLEPFDPFRWSIITNDQSSAAIDKSGNTIWNRTAADGGMHQWEGVGSGGDCWCGVRFHGLLKPASPGGPGSPPPFDASLADIDIHVDSLGLASDGPNGHWPPCGSYEEDAAEDTETGGLYLPWYLVDGDFPAQLPTGSPYKLLTVTLHPKWVGPPNPDTVGDLTFLIVGTGVALYRVSDRSRVTGPIRVPATGFSGEQFALLTNGDFYCSGWIQATFHWDDNLGGATTSDDVRIAPAFANMFVDTNNDGSIDTCVSEGHEHAYASIAQPGVVVCKDRAGDGDNLDHLVEMRLSVSPYLKEGTVTLRATYNGALVQLWADYSKSGTPITFGDGKTWDLATEAVPTSLWIDGLTPGQATLRLEYKSASGGVICEDNIAIYVTDTISYCPSDNFAYAWAPCAWPYYVSGALPLDPVNAVLNAIANHGWNVTMCRYQDTTANDDDLGGCTLTHFQACKSGGVLVVHTHGSGAHADAVWSESEANLDAWKDAGLVVSRDDAHWGYRATALNSWLSANWKPTRDQKKGITFMLSCGAAIGGASSPMASAGGRVMFGYTGLSYADVAASDCGLLLGRMSGALGGGTLRTAGKAFDAGGYGSGFTMLGNPWTTLNPAPVDAFPHVSWNQKGAGCIIFDTYMFAGISADNAVMVTSGTISSRRWFGNGSGSYGISFDYDKTGGAPQALHAEADNCLDTSNSRKMEGDRQTYASDKDWSF